MWAKPMARKQWRCFFCDEVFTSRRWAAEHFGAQQGETVACKLSSHEGHILAALRKAEDELARYRADDGDLMRSIYALEADKNVAVRQAEERGYAKGIEEMKAQGFCVEPEKHAA